MEKPLVVTQPNPELLSQLMHLASLKNEQKN